MVEYVQNPRHEKAYIPRRMHGPLHAVVRKYFDYVSLMITILIYVADPKQLLSGKDPSSDWVCRYLYKDDDKPWEYSLELHQRHSYYTDFSKLQTKNYVSHRRNWPALCVCQLDYSYGQNNGWPLSKPHSR